jgi:hypothetical protein
MEKGHIIISIWTFSFHFKIINFNEEEERGNTDGARSLSTRIEEEELTDFRKG